MKSSLFSLEELVQSLSLPGRFRRVEVALLRDTSACAARLASRARAERMMRPTIASATLMLWFSQCSRPGRTRPSTAETSSGLFRRSLVWPWNCGSWRNTLTTPVSPSRMSSAVIVTPFGERLCVSMKLRTALPMPARSPLSCVPPEPVGMPFTYDRRCSSVYSVHCSTRSSRSPSSFDSVNGASCTGFAPRPPTMCFR